MKKWPSGKLLKRPQDQYNCYKLRLRAIINEKNEEKKNNKKFALFILNEKCPVGTYKEPNQ